MRVGGYVFALFCLAGLAVWLIHLRLETVRSGRRIAEYHDRVKRARERIRLGELELQRLMRPDILRSRARTFGLLKGTAADGYPEESQSGR